MISKAEIPTTTLDIPHIGIVVAWSMQADHVGLVTAETTHNGEHTAAEYVQRLRYDWPALTEEQAAQVVTSFEIRKVPYGMRAHTYTATHFPSEPSSDTRDRVAYERDGWGIGWREPHLVRRDAFTDASSAANQQARAWIVDHVGPWTNTDDGRAFLARGGIYAARVRLARAEEKHAEMSTAAEAARKEVGDAEDALAEALEHLDGDR